MNKMIKVVEAVILAEEAFKGTCFICQEGFVSNQKIYQILVYDRKNLVKKPKESIIHKECGLCVVKDFIEGL